MKSTKMIDTHPKKEVNWKWVISNGSLWETIQPHDLPDIYINQIKPDRVKIWSELNQMDPN